MLRLKKLLCILLAASVLCLSSPQYAARAAMVETEHIVEEAAGLQVQRAHIRSLLQREEVRDALAAYGVDPEEAVSRVEALSDREIALIAERLKALPAGSSGESFLVAVAYALVVGIILISLLGIIWVIKKIAE